MKIPNDKISNNLTNLQFVLFYILHVPIYLVFLLMRFTQTTSSQKYVFYLYFYFICVGVTTTELSSESAI